jgi:hypothetical protein
MNKCEICGIKPQNELRKRLNESSSLISKDIKEKCDKCYIKYGYNSKE